MHTVTLAVLVQSNKRLSRFPSRRGRRAHALRDQARTHGNRGRTRQRVGRVHRDWRTSACAGAQGHRRACTACRASAGARVALRARPAARGQAARIRGGTTAGLGACRAGHARLWRRVHPLGNAPRLSFEDRIRPGPESRFPRLEEDRPQLRAHMVDRRRRRAGASSRNR